MAKRQSNLKQEWLGQNGWEGGEKTGQRGEQLSPQGQNRSKPQKRSAAPSPQTPKAKAHLLAATGSDVQGLCFLAQRLDDGHLGEILHRRVELGQGAAAVALATFDVLGLRFWEGICEIWEQSMVVTHFSQVLPGSWAHGWFGGSSWSTKAPLLPSSSMDLTVILGTEGWDRSHPKANIGTKHSDSSALLTPNPFPDRVCSVNKVLGETCQPCQPQIGKAVSSALPALIFITGDGQV